MLNDKAVNVLLLLNSRCPIFCRVQWPLSDYLSGSRRVVSCSPLPRTCPVLLRPAQPSTALHLPCSALPCTAPAPPCPAPPALPCPEPAPPCTCLAPPALPSPALAPPALPALPSPAPALHFTCSAVLMLPHSRQCLFPERWCYTTRVSSNFQPLHQWTYSTYTSTCALFKVGLRSKCCVCR